jgi:hypothetical protein
MRFNRFLCVDLRIRLHPFDIVLVGDFIVLPKGKCRYSIHAYYAVVSVILGIDHHPEINTHGATLNGNGRGAVLLGKRVLECLQHLQWMLRAEVLLLLANFADSAGTLWVYSKDKPARPSIPENECVERDFYEYELNGRKTSNKYEDWLARIEGNATAALQLLTDRRRLTEREAVTWAAFVAALFVKQISKTLRFLDGSIDSE